MGERLPVDAGQAAAAPPGLGPEVGRTAMARRLTLRTSPQLEQVSMMALRPRLHMGHATTSSSAQVSQRAVPES